MRIKGVVCGHRLVERSLIWLLRAFCIGCAKEWLTRKRRNSERVGGHPFAGGIFASHNWERRAVFQYPVTFFPRLSIHAWTDESRAERIPAYWFINRSRCGR